MTNDTTKKPRNLGGPETVITQINGRFERNAQVLEKVAKRVAKLKMPKYIHQNV
jgi:hypothetical protein